MLDFCRSSLDASQFATQVPFLFKWAVDGLSLDPTGSTPVAAGVLCLTPPALLIMYGVTRAVAAGCNELRNAVFANVRGACYACPHS